MTGSDFAATASTSSRNSRRIDCGTSSVGAGGTVPRKRANLHIIRNERGVQQIMRFSPVGEQKARAWFST
jgi:hypothetical protein